ncbi:MAG TPA: DUF4198 domain-containing protein [Gemmatimonadaceae bacterium]
MSPAPRAPRRPLRLALAGAALLLAATPLLAHDLFLVPDRFRVEAGRPIRVALVNGTFALAENVVERERVRAIRVAAADTAIDVAPTAWSESGETTFVHLPAPPAGTIALGVSLHPATIALAGEDFDAYLVEEGLDEARGDRERRGVAADSARERYAKHAKAVLRVGGGGGEGWGAILGFQAELVPLSDPTALAPGDTLRVRAMSGGLPAVGVALRAGWRAARGGAQRIAPVRTDSTGVAAIPIAAAGRWYVKTIDLRRSTEAGLDYESEWATLTFEVAGPATRGR